MSATQSRQPFTRNCWPPSARRLASANRNGMRERALTGPTGPVALALPRATPFRGAGVKEWTSTIVPRYQRRMPEVNAAVVATYLPGGNTRRIRGALQPLLKAAPLSKSAVSRVIATLKDGLVGVANTLAHRPRRDLRLPRWLRSASAQRREGGQRTGAGCGRCPLRREQTPARSGAVRRGVVCDVERLPRRSRGAWPAISGALHHRREPRTAPRRRRGIGHAPLYNVAASTSFAILSVRRPSTCWPRSATTSTASSTPPMLMPPALLTRPSSARGPNVARAW